MSEKEDVVGQVIGATGAKIVKTKLRGPHLVKRGEFLRIPYEIDGRASWIICRVHRLRRYNPLFTEDLVESASLGAVSLLPETKTEDVAADLEIMGFVDPDTAALEFPRQPPKPGVLVHKMDYNTMRLIFAFERTSSLLLGRLVGYEKPPNNIPVYVSINDLVTQHLAVLAMTGAGKSWTVGRVMENLLATANARMLVLDLHGEYGYMYYKGQLRRNQWETSDTVFSRERGLVMERIKDKMSKGGGIKIFAPKSQAADHKYDGNYTPIQLRLDTLSVEMLSTILPGLTEPQQRVLSAALKIWFEENEPRNPMDLLRLLRDPTRLTREAELAEVERKAISSRSAAIVSLRLRNLLEDSNIFYMGGKYQPTEVETIVGSVRERVGLLSIVDFLDMPLEYAQVAVTALLNEILVKAKIPDRPIPNLFVVLEEAHNFAPRATTPVCKGIISRIASEGRKFGIGLCAISQRPSKLDPDVLSQCNSYITMRMKNPEDLSFVRSVAEYASETDLEEIPSLSTGEALVFGRAFPLSLLVKVGPRHLRHGGVTPDILTEWQK